MYFIDLAGGGTLRANRIAKAKPGDFIKAFGASCNRYETNADGNR
jgi:hypothetical protein